MNSNTKRTINTIMAGILAMAAPAAGRAAPAADSIPKADTTATQHRNTATQFNALKYIREKRFRTSGYTFEHNNSHLYLEFGTGWNKDIRNRRYDLSALTMASVGLGWHASRLHSLRLRMAVGYGHNRQNNFNYVRTQLSADWLFSLSSYIDGYRPARPVDVSAMIGIAYRHHSVDAHLTRLHDQAELHAGLQLRLYAGPQASLTVEPFGGIAALNLNDRCGAIYGINVGIAYYLDNCLSPEERQKYMHTQNGGGSGSGTPTAKPKRWLTPWFVEFASGMARLSGTSAGTSSGVGHTTSIGAGRWFSPVLGLRTSLGYTYARYSKREAQTANMAFADFRAEAIVNPLGLARRFDWTSRAGMYIALGGGISHMQKAMNGGWKRWAVAYTGAINLWWRMADNIRLFVEPGLASYNYHMPNQSGNSAQRCNDRTTSLRIGLAADLNRLYRTDQPDQPDTRALPISVGGSIGTAFVYSGGGYAGRRANYSTGAFGEYHFGTVSAIRLSLDLLSLSGYAPASYGVYNADGRRIRSAQTMFHHANRRGLVTASWLVSLSNMLAGYNPQRRLATELFAGPSLMFNMGCGHSAEDMPALDEGQTIRTWFRDRGMCALGITGGIKLRYRITPDIDLTLTPQINLTPGDIRLRGVGFANKLHGLETLTIGAQYNL